MGLFYGSVEFFYSSKVKCIYLAEQEVQEFNELGHRVIDETNKRMPGVVSRTMKSWNIRRGILDFTRLGFDGPLRSWHKCTLGCSK